MQFHAIVTSLLVPISLFAAAVNAAEEPWITLFDGKTLDGWHVSAGSPQVVDGRLALAGGSRLECTKGSFSDFVFTTDILTESGAVGGLSLHRMPASPTPANWLPPHVSINNSRAWSAIPRTGSLDGARCQFKSLAKDGDWLKLRIHAQGGRIRVWVNDICVADALGFAHDCLLIQTEEGTAKVFFKDIRLQMLPSDPAHTKFPPPPDTVDRQLTRLHRQDFPLINYHIHLKGDLTLEKALAHSRETGVFYGIAANCGVKFPITNDQGIYDYVKKLEGQPCFIGMQAEGREWPTLFSKEAIAKFDYVFTDAMTIVDHRGQRARLWMPDEVDIPDKQAFMELLVRTIEEILDNEPVDIYANPTYLPDMLIQEYDTLWTPQRVKRVIDAAARNGVAIEISNRLKLPKADFIRQAKQAGIKFTIGTNNVDSKLGREEYALQMIHECGLKASDMFLPKPDGKKPIQVRGFKSKSERKEPTEK